jgi:hypothetical protein
MKEKCGVDFFSGFTELRGKMVNLCIYEALSENTGRSSEKTVEV